MGETTRPHLAVALLTEADMRRGFGHLGRCCSVYDALAELGVDATLLVAGEAPAHVVEEREWAQCEWTGAASASATLAGFDAAVVDSYEADAETYSAIAEHVGAAAYFDDTARLDYPRGLVVNAGISATELDYTAGDSAEYLLGPAYQPLRREFWDVPLREAPRPELQRVLVVFGGGGSPLLEPVLEALHRAHPDVEFDVVRAPRSAAEMRDAMLRADAAITAGGQTICELARTGTPSVCVSLAENQLAQARGWAAAGASIFAGTSDDPDIASALADRLADVSDPGIRAEMSAAGAALVDGRGSLRIARALLGRALDARTRLEPASFEHAEKILRLSNDPAVRESSLSTQPIAFETHAAWLADRIAQPERAVTLLAWDGPALAGQVRFDVSGAQAVVSISIAEKYRGLGWSGMLLERAARRLAQTHPHVSELVAVVRPENAPSRRLFERAGFEAATGTSADATNDAVEYRRAV